MFCDILASWLTVRETKSPYSNSRSGFDHRGKTWASTTHRQFSLQAVAVATVNATFDWVASESKRVLREVLQVREKERRLEVTPPVACARPIEAAARDDGDKATDPYDDIGDDVDLGAGDAE